MKLRWVLTIALSLLMAAPASAADGMFRGRVIDAPTNQPVVAGWIYLEGRNHMLRRVEVAHATIVFSDEIPASQRRKCKAECLIPGLEVRVTARQDASGEWRARRVEILRLTANAAKIATKRCLYENLPRFAPFFG